MMKDDSVIAKRTDGLAMLALLLAGAASLAGCDGSATCAAANVGADAAPVPGNEDGGADATPVADAKPASSVLFATALTTTYCDGIAACCRQAGDDPSLCRVTLEPYLTAAFTVLLSDPRVEFDEAGAARCLAAYSAALSACTDRALQRMINPACNGVFRGNVPPGGTCESDGNCLPPATGFAICQSGVCTQTADNPNPWSADTPHLTAGQTCNGTCSGSSCNGTSWCWTQDGLYCGESKVCTAVAAVGQPCSTGNYCEDSGHCQSGMCVADVATGPCTSDDDCVPISYCIGTSRTCTPRRANGEVCSTDRECVGGQCETGRCRTWSMSTPAACAGLLD